MTLIYPNHSSSPWPDEDVTRDRLLMAQRPL
jgi:hypothetical protein